MMQTREISNTFTTRNGDAITLKPWTWKTVTGNATNLSRFVRAFAGLSGMTNEDDSGEYRPREIAALEIIGPVLEVSVQAPEMLEKVGGIRDIVGLVRAIWEYNEVGEGLGEVMALHLETLEAMQRRNPADSSGSGELS